MCVVPLQTRSEDLGLEPADASALEEVPVARTVGGQRAELSPAAAAAAAAAGRYAASRPPPPQRTADTLQPGEIDVTTAFEHADDAETEREEQILAAWGTASASENARGTGTGGGM
jgi:hypothetical protein